MKVKINLSDSQAATLNEICVWLKGYVVIDDEIIHSASHLLKIISELSLDISKIKHNDFLHKLNGNYLILIQQNTTTIIISDVIRSFPVFYKKDHEEILLSDKLENISPENVCNEGVTMLLKYGNTLGDINCFKNVFSSQAGEIIIITEENIHKKRYFEFIPHSNEKHLTDQIFADLFIEKMENSISRMIKSVDRIDNWIIPLSGGHDSRILVNFLKKIGITNVICYSYGTENNKQSTLSKQVAESIGYDWHFVEYNEYKWSELHSKGIIDKYIDFAFQGVSTPHLQDLLAVYELKRKKIINEHDVFIPGHALDFIAGSHFTETDSIIRNKLQAVKRVAEKFNYGKLDDDKYAIEKIYNTTFSGEPKHFQEFINWQERQAKFIVNSCRVYEFFNFKFRLPFWDRELVNLFLDVPEEQRIKRNLMLSSERKGILIDKIKEIPFEDELKNDKKNNILRDILVKILPNFLKIFLLRLSKKKVKLAEGLNEIYAQKGNTVEDIVGPLKIYPKNLHSYLSKYMKRYPYQMDYHLLSAFYAVKRAISTTKKYE